jgi:hypothetical protein
MNMHCSYHREGNHGVFQLAGWRNFADAKEAWELFFRTSETEQLAGVLILD